MGNKNSTSVVPIIPELPGDVPVETSTTDITRDPKVDSEYRKIEKRLNSEPFVVRYYARGQHMYYHFLNQLTDQENSNLLSSEFCKHDIEGRAIKIHAENQPLLLVLLFDSESVVQEEDFTFAAFAMVTRPPYDECPQPCLKNSLYIDILCTSEKSRSEKKGYGTAMIHAIETFAKQKGFKYVELDSLDSAKGFYTKLGYNLVPMDASDPSSTDGWMRKSLELTGGSRLRLKTLRRSHKKEKKWDAVFEQDGKEKVVPFGQRGYSDFTKHKDTKRRQRYIDRHSGMGEDWKDPTTPGALSRYILWNKKTLRASLKDFKKKFHV